MKLPGLKDHSIDSLRERFEAGGIQRWRAELFGVEPELTDGVVGIYRHEWAFSSERAQRELGYRITPFETGIASTVEWLRREGVLPRGG